MLTVADVLETPRLARVYAHVLQQGPVTVEEISDTLDTAQTTTYQDVNRLLDGDLLVVTEGRPREYTTRPISLGVETAEDAYTVTPALVAAIGHREDNPDIDVYLDRHGVAGLATALDYAYEYIEGEMNARVMARRHDLTVVEAETILQALRDVVLAVDELSTCEELSDLTQERGKPPEFGL
jgi:hypothetical protein